MFVFQSKYDKLEDAYIHLNHKYNKVVENLNNLVRQVNAAGGLDAMRKAQAKNNDVPRGTNQFTTDELKSLLRLVHPDKHGGSNPKATQLTAKINGLLGK